jgi:hypothetical protein
MSRVRLLSLVAGVGCAAPLAATPQPTGVATPTPIAIERLANGSAGFSPYSGLRDSLNTVVRDSLAWRDMWRQINQPFVPQPALPAVDFSKEMVIVTALGARQSGGYDVVIEGATLDSSAIDIAVRHTRPAPGCPVEAVVTQPVDVAKMPRATRSVRFHERHLVVPCGAR